MTIHIRAQQVINQPPPVRSIHPNIVMDNENFLRGYTSALRSPNADEAMTDEEIVDIVLEVGKGAEGEMDAVFYAIGNLVGLIVASC